ncbi:MULTISPECIES: hypothetical protein [unclassified Mesorhizobium]|uniref:hypothetical protein n=1 Tax=unclassified Mesorhizobium TaxID=325217 RepID=UPI001FE010C5|nr:MULTISPECIES: hypothetical protein [unclassified Mesorhizobium]
MKTMQEKDIPAFVQSVVDAGCNICAIGNLGYVFGDADLTPAQRRAVEHSCVGLLKSTANAIISWTR